MVLSPSASPRNRATAARTRRALERLGMRPHALAEHATIVIAESTRRLVCNLLQTACLGTGHIVEQAIGPNRSAWVQLTRGAATLNGHAMKEGDAAAMNDEDIVYVEAKADCEVLLLDLR